MARLSWHQNGSNSVNQNCFDIYSIAVTSRQVVVKLFFCRDCSLGAALYKMPGNMQGSTSLHLDMSCSILCASAIK